MEEWIIMRESYRVCVCVRKHISESSRLLTCAVICSLPSLKVTVSLNLSIECLQSLELL